MILDNIIKASRLQLSLKKERISIKEITHMALAKPQPLDLTSALGGQDMKLIAEVKKASPSRGTIVKDFDPLRIAGIYTAQGAAAISVLTETDYFQGSLDYLLKIYTALGPGRPPLLRKDFIYDPYQVFESRAYGADAVLLIAAILSPTSLYSLIDLTYQLGMSSLVEVHNENEVEIALKSGARIIGINNRDLNTFEVNLDVTRRLSRLIPSDRLLVSESGIKNREDIRNLRGYGVRAVLVGESLLKSDDIAARMRELL
jgi:indole-3-glycerol phosphate synthase